MWAWIIGLFGVGGIAAAALVFAASRFSVLAPFAAIITGIAKAAWRVLTAAFVWSWRQAVAAKYWTAVMLAIALLVGWWTWDHGFVRGDTAGYARASADLKQCRANNDTLETAITGQNAKITALSQIGDALRAENKVLSARYQDDVKTLQARLAALAANKPTGANEYERAKSARQQIEDDRRWQYGQVPASHGGTP
jgi:hypothetical protein